MRSARTDSRSPSQEIVPVPIFSDLECFALGHMIRAMGIQVSGKLHLVKDVQQITERFKKRELVLELGDNSRYPQFVLFQLTGDRTELLDGFRVGEEVKLDFSLRGREWTSPTGEVKFFNSLDVWTIDRANPPSDDGFDQSIEESSMSDAQPTEFDDEIPF